MSERLRLTDTDQSATVCVSAAGITSRHKRESSKSTAAKSPSLSSFFLLKMDAMDAPAPSSDAMQDDVEGMPSESQIESSLKLLKRLSKGGDLHEELKRKRYRSLRTAAQKFCKSFTGSVEANKSETHAKAMKNLVNTRRDQLRKLDQKYIRATKLRADRLAKLKSLQSETQLLLCAPPEKEEVCVCVCVYVCMCVDMVYVCQEGVAEVEEFLKKVTGYNSEYSSEGGARELFYHRGCYVCKKRFTKLHFFYDMLCYECAELNYQKREAVADLSGKVILLTGARVKIGFECGKKLLRCGATVLATSRFPKDCMCPQTWQHYHGDGDGDSGVEGLARC